MMMRDGERGWMDDEGWKERGGGLNDNERLREINRGG